MSGVAILAILIIVYVNQPASWLYSLTVVGVWAIATVGVNLLTGHAGQLSFGQIIFLEVGSYSSAILTTRYGLNPWLAILAGVGVSLAIAVLIGLATLRLSGFYFAIGTFALALGFGAFALASSFTGAAIGVMGIPPLSLGAYSFAVHPQAYYVLTWAVCILAIAAIWLLMKSYIGRAWRTLAVRADVAEALGIRTTAYKLLAFAISAVITSIAGSIYAEFVTFVGPDTFSYTLVVSLFFMLIIGGVRSVIGPIVGAAVYIILPLYINIGDYETMIISGLLVLLIVVRPSGIFGRADDVRPLSYLLPDRVRLGISGVHSD